MLETISLYLLIVPISYGAYGYVMNANAAFNGLGFPGRSVVISTVRMLVLYLPLAWIGSRAFGVSGIFVGAAAANLLTGGLALAWVRSTVNAHR